MSGALLSTTIKSIGGISSYQLGKVAGKDDRRHKEQRKRVRKYRKRYK